MVLITLRVYANKPNTPKAFTSSAVTSLRMRNAVDICAGYDHLVQIVLMSYRSEQ